MWHAADFLLDRKSDLLFDLLSSQRRSGRVDLHLNWGRIGEGVDIKMRERENPNGGADSHSQDHPEAMAKRNIYDPIQHCFIPSVSDFRFQIADCRFESTPSIFKLQIAAPLPFHFHSKFQIADLKAPSTPLPCSDSKPR